FAEHGASQYADIELAFYTLGSVGLWAWSDRDASPSAAKIALSGMLAGMAAWTKNEGQLLIPVILTARVLCRLRSDSIRKIAGELAIWLLGAAPFLLAVAYFRATLAPPSDLFSRDWTRWVEKLSDPERYRVIAKTWVETLPRFGRWRFGLPVALLIYAAAVGRNPGASKLWRFPFLTLALMALGYFFVYVLTPYDVPWHLSTSLDRLYFQLWPLGLFAAFLWLRAPEEFARAE
ncbi:MAG TPA: hypothetical protein VJR29_08460, partial [bacterium]|nr:hypothetical protein [bacterium]